VIPGLEARTHISPHEDAKFDDIRLQVDMDSRGKIELEDLADVFHVFAPGTHP
jgi:hypothetical protein